MRIVIPDVGALRLLDLIWRDADGVSFPWELGLFANPLVPDEGTVWADIVEPTWLGYHRVTVTRDKWQAPALVDGVPTIVYDTTRTEWQAGGAGGDVYGWWMAEQVTRALLLIQAADEPLAVGPLQRMWVWPRCQLSTLIVCPE